MELLTAAQMREIEAAEIASGRVTGLRLMERAGRGAVDAIFAEWPKLAEGAHHAVVLCGPGNNGGDGFVVARRLHDKGWRVEVFLYGDPARLPPDARKMHDLWCEMGAVAPLDVAAAGTGKRPALLVDALFGTGVSRAIPLDCALALHAVEDRDVGDTHPWLAHYHRVALDCPSGFDCDSGQFLMPQMPDIDEEDLEGYWRFWSEDASKRIIRTDLVLPFHRPKVGQYLEDVGATIRVVDIGLGKDDRHPGHLIAPREPGRVCLLDFDPPKGRSARIWPGSMLRRRSASEHKFDHGHALVLAGGVGKGGAARMAARAALRVGAGLVTLGVPPAALIENAARLDVIMLRRLNDADALEETLQDDRITALCLGPGLGTGPEQAALVLKALRCSGESLGGRWLGEARGVVLDADALTILSQDEARLKALHPYCVLTPHAGEFARLFPDIAERLKGPATAGPAFSKIDAAREAAARSGCLVVFKGAATVIADPDGRVALNAALYDRAAPWLATAGAGDVLAGMITGLMARGLAPLGAAELAAWLHVEAARDFGPGLIAEDLPDALPALFQRLGL